MKRLPAEKLLLEGHYHPEIIDFKTFLIIQQLQPLPSTSSKWIYWTRYMTTTIMLTTNEKLPWFAVIQQLAFISIV